MYVAVMPHVFKIREEFLKTSSVKPLQPWAAGHSLFIRFQCMDC